MSPRIEPSAAYYIKLGRQGRWEQECLEQEIIRFGYNEVPHEACLRGQWDDVGDVLRALRGSNGAASNDLNQIRAFYEADESVLWMTFSGGCLWWCFARSGVDESSGGTRRFRRTIGPWRNVDVNGDRLTADRLSGSLLKVQAFRGTICKVAAQDYLVRRLNGKSLPAVQEAHEAERALLLTLVPLMQLLTWRDFELLVDLVFASSGWRRLAVIGKTQKTVDLELVLPTTGERAFVQVKSSSSTAELQEYCERHSDANAYDRMFFVWHSGDVEEPAARDVTLIPPERLARMVLDAGLVSWLRQKVA